jgi:hypothetical protein
MRYLFFVTLLTFHSTAQAQDFAALFRPGASPKSFSFEESFYAPAKVSGSDRELQQRQWRVRAGAPVWSNGKQEVTVAAEAGDLVLHHPSAALRPYRNVQGTMAWRYFGQNDKVRSVNASYGSASDRPFARSANNTQSANYLHQFNAKWWGVVNYSNNRNFANGVPLPGFFYAVKMSREETLLLGLPVIFWRKRYASGFDLHTVAFLPWNYRFQAGYYWDPFTGVTLGFEHQPQQYFREDREQTRERFFYREQKIVLALNGAVIPRVLQWRLEVGRAFNRSFFEAENFSSKKNFDVPVGDANFAAVQLTSMF